MAFIFGGNTGVSNPQELARQREIVQALMMARGAPRNVGEGLNALGDGIVANVLGRRANKAETAGQESASSAFGPILAALSGGGTGGVSTAPQAAQDMAPMDPASKRVSDAFAAQGAGMSGGGTDIESYIRQAALQRGIDPEVAIRVAKSEGGLKDPFRQSDIVKNGVREQSYGPFQLYMGGGMGNDALKAGIDPRKDWQGGINFALDQAAKGGWGPWYGAQKIGVTGMHGINPGGGAQAQLESLAVGGSMPTPGPQMTSDQVARSYAQTQGIDPASLPPQPAPGAPTGPGAFGEVRSSQDGTTYKYMDDKGWAPVDIGMMGPDGQRATAQGNFPPAPPKPGAGQMAQSGPTVQQLLQAAQNPWLNDNQRAIVNTLLERQLEGQDPSNQLDMEYKRAQLDALRNKPAEAPTVKQLKLDDGSEVAVQWNPQTQVWDPINAPSGGAGIAPPRKLTESQSKLTLFQTLQTQTQPVLLDLEKQFNPANMADAAARSTPIAGNFFQSEQGQMYDAASTAWAEGALRIATGAAATPEEMTRTKKAYFAHPGDTPTTIAFKAQMREMYNRAIDRALGGEGAGELPKPSDFATQFGGSSPAAPKKPLIIDGYSIEEIP